MKKVGHGGLYELDISQKRALQLHDTYPPIAYSQLLWLDTKVKIAAYALVGAEVERFFEIYDRSAEPLAAFDEAQQTPSQLTPLFDLRQSIITELVD